MLPFCISLASNRNFQHSLDGARFGFVAMANIFKGIIDLCRNVSEGDSEALQKSGMEDSTLGKPDTPKLAPNDLCAEHYKACLIQTSAEILGMNMLGLLCKDYINVLNFLAKKCHQFELQPTTLEPQDYADTLQELLTEVSENVMPLERAFSKETKDDCAAVPPPDAPVDEKSESPEVTATELQPGCSSNCVKRPRESSPANNTENTSRSSPKKKSKTTTKAKHYVKQKCPLCKDQVVHLRRHLITMHSQRKERIPIAKVEALMQASRHGKETLGGKVTNKNKNGSLRVNKRAKMVCPLCEAITMYLETHLRRVHHLEKGSDAYNEALQKKRRYLGRRKEVKCITRAVKNVQVKNRIAKKNTPNEDEQPAPSKTPLQILVEEAEASDSSDEFGGIVPPTPPPITEEESPVAPLILEQPPEENPAAIPNIEQPAQALCSEDSDSDEDYVEEEEDDEDEEDEVFLTLKEYYARGTAKTDREKFYVMFCDQLKNIIGGCKKEWQAILHTQHV